MSRARLVAISILAATTGGCGWLDDSLRTCSTANVDLVNSVQNVEPIHLLGPVESTSDATQLEPGEQRRTTQCLNRGDKRRYRAIVGPDVIATIECVASRASYEGVTIEVIWKRSGLSCEGW